MAKKEFQAESKKLMDMMINSIYTNKEIFLRELISNASDAIDKLYYKSLTDPSVGMNKGDFRILITRDKENRILTIEDNGIGMTKEELEQNLGTIAHSGSLDFKKDNKDENIDIIGQFGVGFYSSFMVADKVTVISKAYGSDEAWQWESSGVDGYEMTPAQKDTAGTQIILHIKPDTETDHYDNFLDEYGIVAIVKKYSDYVRYPIQMERQHERQKPEPDPKPEGLSARMGDLHRAGNSEQHGAHLEKAEERSDRTRSTRTSIRKSLAIIPTPPASSSAAPRALQIIMPCCSCPATVPTTSTPRIMKRAWPCTHPACSLWRSAPTCCPITSASSRALWTVRI